MLVTGRAETLALHDLLLAKGIITEPEFQERVARHHQEINKVLSEQFPDLAMVLAYPFGGPSKKGH